MITHAANVTLFLTLHLFDDSHMVLLLMICIGNSETGRKEENKIVLLWERIIIFLLDFPYIADKKRKRIQQEFVYFWS